MVMFWKRMRMNFLITALMLLIIFLYVMEPAMAYGGIVLFFLLNMLIEWEDECERNEWDAYNKKIND